MSVSASAHPLILGIGNPLRGDDGLGWAVADQLAQDGELVCAIRTVHQLTPELAQEMALARLVVMIDASHEGEPGEVRVRPVSPSVRPGAAGTHHTAPEELAALTLAIYGHCPPIVVVTLTGAQFGIGEQFSPQVACGLPGVCAAVRRLCA